MGVALSCSGCLTIEEHYVFKKNGSGNMEFVVDMSALAEMMDGLSKMGGTEGSSDEGMGDMDMASSADRLREIPGISKVKLNSKKTFVQRVSFKFRDVTALNKALRILMPDSLDAEHDFFTWDGSTLVRTNNGHAMELGEDMADDDADDREQAEAFLKGMKYKYSFRFASTVADRTVAEGMSVDAPSPRELLLETDWSAIMTDPGALDLRIRLDK